MISRTFVVLGACAAAWPLACSTQQSVDLGSNLSGEFQYAAIDEPDGGASLYSGFSIADKLAREIDVESLDNRGAFLRVRVPRALLDSVQTSPTGRTIISLEEPYPGVEILMHDFDPEISSVTHEPVNLTRMKNTTYVPGQPWLSGRAMVERDDQGQLIGGVNFQTFSNTLPSGSLYLVWGLVDCDGDPVCPRLRYFNPDWCTWPAVPPGWTLMSSTGEAITLDHACGRD